MSAGYGPGNPSGASCAVHGWASGAVPYGGGRADARLAIGGDGEIYIVSKPDGMIRKLTAVVVPPPAR